MDDDELRTARDIIIGYDAGELPSAAVLPFTFVEHHNPDLAAALVAEYGPLDAMTAILVADGQARPLTVDDWP